MSCSDSDEDWKNSSSLFRRRFRHRRRPQILRSLKIARTRGTIGPLSYNAFKMAPGFRGILELSRTLFNVCKIADMLQQISPFVRPFPLPIVSRALSFFPLPSLPTTRTGRCAGERHKLKAALSLYVDNYYRRIWAQQSVTRLRHPFNKANGLLIVAELLIISIVMEFCFECTGNRL